MAQPWTVVDAVPTEEGTLELRRRGIGDFLITVGNRVLMNSANHGSEAALGRLACADLGSRRDPRVLVGGLGMGYTLRAVLDCLPRGGRLLVAEINPAVVEWCRGPLAPMNGHALDDPRVEVQVEDVAEVLKRHATGSGTGPFDAVVLDLYQGPHAGSHKTDDPLYGRRAIETARSALRPGGMLAVWGEDHDAGFEKRLRAAGFAVTWERRGRGGYRHAVYFARAPERRPGRGRSARAVARKGCRGSRS